MMKKAHLPAGPSPNTKAAGCRAVLLAVAANITVRFKSGSLFIQALLGSFLLPHVAVSAFFPPETFWKNPQYTLVLKEKDENEDEDDDDDVGDDGEDDDDEMEDQAVTPDSKKKAEKQKQKVKRCTVLVELLQKHRRQRDKLNFMYIAFHVYKVPYLSSFNVSASQLFFLTHSCDSFFVFSRFLLR